MANSVTIRTAAPGAKQAATEIGMLKASIAGVGSKVGGPLGGMLGGLDKMALTAGAATLATGALWQGVQEVGKWLGEGAKSAMEEETSLARLDTALQNNVKNWDGNRDAIDEAIQKRIALGFTDDDLRESMGNLVVSTRDAEDALRLQGLAMDVARGRGIDLAAATDMIIKANNGQVGALRRLGLRIDSNATSQEALNVLMESYTGQAAKYGDTLEGALEQANIRLDEAQEAIGAKLLPLFKDMADVANDDVLPAVEDLVSLLTGDYDMSNSFIRGAIDMLAMLPGVAGDAAKQMQQQLKLDEMAKEVFDRLLDAQAARDAGEKAGGALTDGFTGQIKRGGRDAKAEAIALGKAVPDLLTDNLVDGVRDNESQVEGVMEELTFAMTHPLKRAKELARIEGALTGDKLAEALKSRNPFIRDVAIQTKEQLIAQWEQLSGKAYTEGTQAANALERGLRTFTPVQVKAFKVNTPNDPGKNRGHADGGYIAPGDWGVVGERGPEIVHGGPAGMQVFSNAQSRSMGTGNVNVRVSLSTRHFNSQTRHYGVTQGKPVFQGGF